MNGIVNFAARQKAAELKTTDPGLVETPTMLTIDHILGRGLDEHALVTIRGGVGTGKSEAALRFASRHQGVGLVSVKPRREGPKVQRVWLCNDLADDAHYYARLQATRGIASPYDALRQVVHSYELVIIDEANEAGWELLSTLRVLRDELRFGLALLGNPTLLQRGRDPWQYDALLSRCEYWHEVPIPTNEDIAMVLDAWRIAPPKSRALLEEIARGGQGLRKMVQVIKRAIALGGAAWPPRLDILTDAAAQLGHRH